MRYDAAALKDTNMLDLNNRPGGPNLIVTAKTAHKVHFLDAATLTMDVTLDMPGSTHELALSPDGRTAYGTVYGDGIFAKRVNPDRRIVVIDLPSKTLKRVIDLGAIYAPHGVMMDNDGLLWSSGELGNSVLAIDPATDKVDRVEVGSTAHWVAVSHATGKVFASVKQDWVAAIDIRRRVLIDRIKVPHIIEGLAISPDGGTLYCCGQTAAEFYAIDAGSHAITRTVPIEGADGGKRQMRRVRVSPDGKYVVVSSNQDHHVAIYEAGNLRQIAQFPTKRSPMGFGFAPGGRHAYVCCHDDNEVWEFELATGKVTRTFPTASGCEFIVAYH
jgi:DNA-binding beta-propeller fold protein YncE